MANAGTSGGDWDRLEAQLSATRSELAHVTGAVSGLTELVTDLVRRSGAEHQDERWQARLGSLETRLGMLETGIRGEVERMRATAGAVDALADDFRTTVGGTRNLVDLAETISDRISSLQSLERQVRGAAQDVAGAVEARLAAESDARDATAEAITGRVERIESAVAAQVSQLEGALTSQAARVEDAVATRVAGVLDRLEALADVVREQDAARARLEGIDRAVAASQQALAELGARVESVSSATSELPAIEERLAGRVDQATAWGDQLEQLQARIADLHAGLNGTAERQGGLADAVVAMSAELSAVRADLDNSATATRGLLEATLGDLTGEVHAIASQLTALSDTADDDARLREIASALAQVRAQQPHLAMQLDQLSSDLAALRTGVAEPDTEHAVIVERIDGLAAAMRTLVTAFPDPRPQLEQLSVNVAQLAGSQPDPRPQLDELAAAIAQLREAQPEATHRLDRLANEIEQLRTALPDGTALAERVTYLLDEQAATLLELRAVHPQQTDRLERIANDVAALQAVAPPQVELGPLLERLDRFAVQLNEELTAAREHAPELAVDLEPILARLDTLGEQLSPVRTSLPNAEGLLARVASLLNDHSAVLTQLQAGQPQLAVRLDQLAVDIAELAALAQAPEGPDPAVERLDQLAGDLAAFRQSQTGLLTGDALMPLQERIDRLSRELSALGQRSDEPDPSVERLDRLAGDVAAFRERLDAVIEVLAAPTEPPPDVRPALDQLAAAVDGMRNDLLERSQTDATAPLVERIDALAVRLDERGADPALLDSLTRLSSSVQELHGRQVDPRPHLDQLLAATTALAERQPDLGVRLDQVQAELADLRVRLPDPAGAVAPVIAQLDSLAADIARLAEAQAPLDRLAAEVAALREAQPEAGALDNAIELALGTRVDRITAEIVALRGDQPDVGDLRRALDERFDAVAHSVDAVMARVSEPPPEPSAPLDVSLLLEPLTSQLTTVDARAAATSDAVAGLDGAITRATTQLDDIAAQLANLRDAPDETAFALAPVIDRLAIVVDTVSGVHSDVASLADSVATLRNERAQLVQLSMEANGRLDLLSANVAEMRQAAPDVDASFADTNERLGALAEQLAELRTNRPDFTASFLSITELIDGLQSGIVALQQRVDGVTELVRSSEPPVVDVAGAVGPLAERLAALSVDVAALHTAVPDLGSAILPVIDRLTALDERISALPAPTDASAAIATLTERIDAISSRLSELQADRPDFGASLTGLADLVDGVQTSVRDLHARIDTVDGLVRASERTDAYDAVVASVSTLGDAMVDVQRELRDLTAKPEPPAFDVVLGETIRPLEQRVTAAVNELTARVEALAAASDEDDIEELREQLTALSGDVRSAVRAVLGLGADITGLRNDVEQLATGMPDPAAERAGIVDQVRADVGNAVTAVDDTVHLVHDDIRSTRSELDSVRRLVDQVQTELRRARESEMASGAATLIASAAAAMARLEIRIDGEFDGVGRQMEAVGTLLAQAIEAIHRIEAQVVGAHPGAERMRTSAASVLDSLRTNVRQRAARRAAGPPAELGSGQ